MDNPNIDNAESVKNPSPFITFTARTIPATFDTSMSYQEALFALVNYLQTQVTPAINENAKITNEQTRVINELYYFVNHYFDDLNVQEEINNKLDSMVEDGTLAEIINQEIFGELSEQVAANTEAISDNTSAITTLTTDYGIEVHYPTTSGVSGTRQAIKFKDFTAILDLGIKDYLSNFIGYLVSNGMTTIKYVVISHFDIDHTGDLQSFIAFVENVNLDFTGCKFIFPHTPDWTRMSGVDGQKQRFEDIRDYLLGENYEIIYASSEGQEIEIDDGNKFVLYNCTDAKFDPYYSIELMTDVTDYNNFSLVTKVETTNNHSFVFPGDINETAQNSIADELGGYDVLAIPHHGSSMYAGNDFLNKFNPSIGVLMNGGNDTLYQNALVNQFADYDRNLYSSLQSGNVVIDGRNLNVNSQNGSVYPKFNNIIKSTDDLNDYVREGVYHYRENSGAPANSIYNYNSQFRLDVKEIGSGICIQTLTGIRSVYDVWHRKINVASSAYTTWQCDRPDLIQCVCKSTAGFTSSYTQITLEDGTAGYTGRLVRDGDTIKCVSKIGLCHLTGKLNITGLQAGDRITARVMLGGNDVCHIDQYANGSYLNLTFDNFVYLVEGGVIKVEVRNLTGNRGTLEYGLAGYNQISIEGCYRD